MLKRSPHTFSNELTAQHSTAQRRNDKTAKQKNEDHESDERESTSRRRDEANDRIAVWSIEVAKKCGSEDFL